MKYEFVSGKGQSVSAVVNVSASQQTPEHVSDPVSMPYIV
jgi:hypothetical protein